MLRLFAPWLLLIFIFLLDFYVFQALKIIAASWATDTSRKVFITYWIISFLSVGLLIGFFVFGTETRTHLMRNYIFSFVACLFIAKFISGMFFVLDDARRILQYLASLAVPTLKPTNSSDGGISRSVFFSWMGFVTGGGIMGSLIYGFGNKYRYTVRNIQLKFHDLPSAFKGYKIVHISDIHSGSFTDALAVQRGIELINRQDADIILFTGDLVNYTAREMEAYIPMFSTLQSRHGVFSILGNHDYGFPKFETFTDIKEAHMANAAEVENSHQALGWRLLRNESEIIAIGDESIAIIGVENISARAGFPSYGNLSKAYESSKQIPFKILMSHDPSHWDAEVTSGFKDIQLTLSGHTHGMQFGFEIPGFKWSPVKYIYKQWAGLYQENHQKLYVNRGFGFIGYPGRVGILPEITVLELV